MTPTNHDQDLGETPLERKPFVEPSISAPEDILDVTKVFAFQVLTADTSSSGIV